MTLKKRTITSIIITLLILVIVVFIYFFTVSGFVKENQKNADNIALINIENKRVYDVSMLKQQILVAKAQQEKIDQYFLRKDQIAPFLGFIESIGNDTGGLVTISSVEIIKNTKNNSLAVRFKISGTYQQIMTTIERVEKIPYYNQINKIVFDIVPDTNGGSVTTVVDKNGKTTEKTNPIRTPLWSADISMVVFSFIDVPINTTPNIKQ